MEAFSGEKLRKKQPKCEEFDDVDRKQTMKLQSEKRKTFSAAETRV